MALALPAANEIAFDEIEAKVGALHLVQREPILCKSWEEQNTTLEQKLRNVACLPQNILSKVIAFLDAKSLAQAAQVCKLWRKICGGNNADNLDLSLYNNVTDQTLYIQLNNYPLLTKLNLSGCTKITSNAITYIQKLAHNLVALKLRGCKWFNSRSVATLLGAQLSNLEELGLGYCINLSDDSLGMLLSATPKLKHLDIAGCTRISDNGIAHAGCMSSLTSLNISNIPNLTEKCLASLNNPVLESLTVTIKKNPTSKSLIKAQALPSLRDISFVSCTVPLMLLNELPQRYPNLVTISLVNCPNMTEEKVAAIQKHKSVKNISITGCSHQNKRKFPDAQIIGGKQVQSSFLAERLPLDYNANFFNNPQNFNHL